MSDSKQYDGSKTEVTVSQEKCIMRSFIINFASSSDTIRVIRGWNKDGSRMAGTTYSYKIVIGKIKKGRNHFECFGTDGWVTLQCTCECVKWIQVAKDTEKWRGLVNMIIKFRVPKIAEEFLERIMTTGLTERTRLISVPNYSRWSTRLGPDACLWNEKRPCQTKHNNARRWMWWQRVTNHYFIWGL